MKAHINYLKYVIKHKYYVFLASRKTGVSLFRAIIHDWHKFLPDEWFSYVHTFYAKDGSKQYKESPEFAYSWCKHQRRGKHHWQHWIIVWDRGDVEPLKMESKYVKEMIADWAGAGKAITGSWGPKEWYEKNKEKIKLHPESRKEVESLLANTVFE